jgi:O-antigen ligase
MIAPAMDNPHGAARARKAFGYLLEAILIATLAVAPLGLGGNRVWAWTVLELLVALAAIVWLAKTAVDGHAGLLRMGGLGWAAAGLVALVALQIAPVPMPLARLISPRAAEVHAAAHASQGLPPPAWAPLSIAPHATRVELWKLGAVAGLFVLVLNHARTPGRAARLAAAIVLVGVFQALYGVAERFSEQPSIFGYVPGRGFSGARMARGTFVNGNHFASFLMVPLCLAMAWAVSIRPRRAAGSSFAHRAAGLLGDPRFGKRLVAVWAALAIGTGLVLSASRGAALACAVCAAGAVGLLLRSRKRRRTAILVGLVACLSVGVAMWRGADGLGEEWTFNPRGRTAIWSGALVAFADYPVAGAGWGAFRYAYPPHGETFAGVLVDHAHNEYLEWAAETGVLGLALLALGGALYGVCFVRGLRACPSGRYRILGVGAGLGGLAVLLHGAVDFGLRIPAVAMNLAAALALGLAWTRLHRPRTAGSAHAAPARFLRSRGKRAAAAIVVGGLVAALAAVPVRDLVAWAEVRTADRRSDPKAAVVACTRALAWTPSDPALLLRRAKSRRAEVRHVCHEKVAEMVARLLGAVASEEAGAVDVPEDVRETLAASVLADGSEEMRRRLNLAREDARRAVRLAPAAPSAYLTAAHLEMDLAGAGWADPSRLALADRAVEHAVALAPYSPGVRFAAGRYWVRRWSLTASAEAEAAYHRHLARAVELRRRLGRPALEITYAATSRLDSLKPILAGVPEAERRLRKFRRSIAREEAAPATIALPAPPDDLDGTTGGAAGAARVRGAPNPLRWDGEAGRRPASPAVPAATDPMAADGRPARRLESKGPRVRGDE